MSFYAYTLSITYFMASLGIMALGLVEGIEAPFMLLTALSAAVSLGLNVRRIKIIGEKAGDILSLAALLLFIVDYIAVSESLLSSGIRFLTILLAFKLFDLKNNRDYLMVFTLVFFQILGSAASTVSPLFFAILSLFTAGAIWAMIIFNIKKDFSAEGSGEPPPGIFGVKFFLSSLTLAALTIAFTLILFLIIPRMGIGLFERKTLNTVKVAGFSDRVDLGTLGPVKTDSTIVMRVEVKDGRLKGPLYLRGIALERYDGKGWSKTVKKGTLLKNSGGAFRLRKTEGKLIEQNILLEPLDTEVLFAAPNAVLIEGRFPNIWVDPAGSVSLPAPPFSKIEYRAWSSLRPAVDYGSVNELDTSTLETEGVGERVRNLTEEIVKGAKTDSERAERIEEYLKANFRYTLDPRPGKGEDPLDEFLFHSKEGYCEHFASAMVLMLRSSGIPARLVTGFLEGEWNGLGSYYIIRQRDAHSWVEAYIHGAGWATFDPTPPDLLGGAKLPSTISLYMDLFRWKWNRYIIQYSFADQMKLATDIEGRTSNLAFRLKAYLKKPAIEKDKIMPAAIIALTAIFAALAFKSLRLKSERVKTPQFYMELLKLLERRGTKKRPDETARELAERSNDERVKAITEAFHKERYSGRRIEKAESEAVRVMLEELKKKD